MTRDEYFEFYGEPWDYYELIGRLSEVVVLQRIATGDAGQASETNVKNAVADREEGK